MLYLHLYYSDILTCPAPKLAERLFPMARPGRLGHMPWPHVQSGHDPPHPDLGEGVVAVVQSSDPRWMKIR